MKKLQTYLPYILTLIVFSAAAWLTAHLLILPELEKTVAALPPLPPEAERPRPVKPRTTVPLSKDNMMTLREVQPTDIRVRIGQQGESLSIRLALAGEASDFVLEVNHKRANLLRETERILASKTMREIRSPDFRDHLRVELRGRLNEVLGRELITAVIITDFLVR